MTKLEELENARDTLYRRIYIDEEFRKCILDYRYYLDRLKKLEKMIKDEISLLTKE